VHGRDNGVRAGKSAPEGPDKRLRVNQPDEDDAGVPQEESNGPATPSRRRAAAAAAPPLPQTIGAELRAAREAAGLSLNDVATRTKVRPGILTDIEADAHDRLPALTYSIGFVKAYARTVGLDPAAAAERYRRESLKGDPVPTMVDLQPLEEQRLPSKRVALLAGAALVLLLGGFWAWGAGWLTPAPPAAPTTPVEVAAPDEAGSPDAGTPADAARQPAVDASQPVTLTAREEVWLRIADGDETFFMGTMTPGQSMTLPQGRAWTLRTGRAGALEVKVGATAIPPLGGAAEQVRNLSLSPADLLQRPVPAAGGLAPTTPVPGAVPPAAAPAAAPVAPAG
jgi:transcriptional regulator with XRE-family HTH domain